MNVFILSWRADPAWPSLAMAGLRAMQDTCPGLDPATAWSFGQGSAFAASVHSAEEGERPRRYVCRDPEEVVFFAQLPVAPRGRFRAHRADELKAHWQDAPSELEGGFAAVRVLRNPESIELLIDPLGMAQVYYLRRGESWLVSNHVSLLARVAGVDAPDPLGVGLALGTGSVGADRTLLEGIKVFPGGAKITWSGNDPEPVRETYYARSSLAAKRRRRFTWARAEALAAQLERQCFAVSRGPGSLTCPITGGRDSRLLAALLINAHVRATYCTVGVPGSTDMRIAERIAAAFNLDHRRWPVATEDITRGWESASREFVAQNDGLVNLWQIADTIPAPSNGAPPSLYLWGVGGEIAGQMYYSPLWFAKPYPAKRLLRDFPQRIVPTSGGLVRPDTESLARAYVRRFVEEGLDEGFAAADVPNLYYAFERVRRWGGSNGRKVLPFGDMFSPYCTRPYLETAFALPLHQRSSEAVLYRVMYLLSSQLHAMPFEKGPWRSQWAVMNLLGRVARNGARNGAASAAGGRKLMYDQASWFEEVRDRVRERCLSSPGSPLWNHIDRTRFEYLVAPATPARARAPHINRLFSVATLFQYEATLNRK